MTRNLIAAHVTRLAREAVFGNARFTTETIAPGAFRVRPLDVPDVESTLRLLHEVRDHLLRFGYDATLSLVQGRRVLTVIDTPRRNREIEEQEARRAEVTERELAAIAQDAARRAEELAMRRPDGCPTCSVTTPGEPCFGCGAVTPAGPTPEETLEPVRLCGLCGRTEAAAIHLGGHVFEPLPLVEVGTMELASAWDGYPPLSIADAEAFLAAGLRPVAEGAGGYSFRIEEADRRHLGRVRCVTEHLGRGIWVRHAAYRPDGSRVGYYGTRLEAAEGLRADTRQGAAQ